LKVAARGTYATQNDLILQHHLLFGACGKWVLSVRSRPFRVRAGTQKTPDGLTLNMQRKTDGLLTHSLAVQSNYFVVPINPALATILARACSWPSENCQPMAAMAATVRPSRAQLLSQGAALLLQDPLDSGGQIA
jgi:hypothetical protein